MEARRDGPGLENPAQGSLHVPTAGQWDGICELGELDLAYEQNNLPFFRADIRLLEGRLNEVEKEGDTARTCRGTSGPRGGFGWLPRQSRSSDGAPGGRSASRASVVAQDRLVEGMAAIKEARTLQIVDGRNPRARSLSY